MPERNEEAPCVHCGAGPDQHPPGPGHAYTPASTSGAPAAAAATSESTAEAVGGAGARAEPVPVSAFSQDAHDRFHAAVGLLEHLVDTLGELTGHLARHVRTVTTAPAAAPAPATPAPESTGVITGDPQMGTSSSASDTESGPEATGQG